ncbi:MAG TPA: HAD-IIA family hydrolase [Jatrophihabitantaceae bacterium]|nr:HAD-IIA family hydrolase [Jatrophihabitantaceae bacterium]
MHSASPLRSSDSPLSQQYDVALLDLDGVVYIGADAVRGAPEALTAARGDGMRLAFVTNNAARPPAAVAAHLTRLGVPAEPGDVINSAQAAAHYLADRLAPGAKVLVLGTTGLIEALRERGLSPVHSADDEPVAVVQGYSPQTDWQLLAEGAVAIGRGALWVATNLDPTVPSPRGPLPGNGSLVAALRHATGKAPISTGKPDPTMHRESVDRSGARQPLVVGDRLDTDIEGADAVGCDSLLVLTGVTGPAELLAAPANMRPTYLAADLGGLIVSHTAPKLSGDAAELAGWRADGELRLAWQGEGRPDPLAALRVLCAASWQLGASGRRPTSADAESRQALDGLGLG